MALNTTGTGTLSDEMKTFYDRRLLARALPTLLHTRFGQTRNIPRGGGKTVEFRSFAALSPNTTALTEGTPPSLKDLSVSAITATIAQYGDAVGLSDLVSTTTIDPILTETVDLLSEEAAEVIDTTVRDILVAGTNVMYGGSATSRVTLAAGDNMTVALLRQAVLNLKVNRAKPISGRWVAIAHPRVMFDIQATTEWVNANQYAGSKRIFDGSVGTLYGIEFFETDMAAVFEGAGASAEDVYATLLLGRDAFGVINLAGHNLQTFHKPLGSAGTADPIDQQQSFGWKTAFTAKILHQPYMVRVETTISAAAS